VKFAKRDPDGSASVEIALLAPVLMILVLLIVVAGRSGEALQQVKHAADQGARAASVAEQSRRVVRGTTAALQDLQKNGVSCMSSRVDVQNLVHNSFRSVAVTVSCTVNHSGLSLLRLGSREVTARSVEVLDVYRAN
jgi:Flp pilus assembly protein TadG